MNQKYIPSTSYEKPTFCKPMVRSLSTEAKRVIFVRMEPGEDILKTIEAVASEHGIRAGQLTLIGAISKARLGFFERESMEYKTFTVDKDLEVVSCTGNIASTFEGGLIVHAHMVIADQDGRCYGGHLMPGCEVSVTLELIITEMNEAVKRARDEATGLNLLDIK